MIIGILSDTHGDSMGATRHIIAEFKRRHVEQIIHCGDIIPEHVSRGLYGNLPVICALVDGQDENPVLSV